MHRLNKPNGFSGKTGNYNSNNIHLKIPRDRNRSFENKLLPEIEKWKSQKIENFYPIL
nr:hypothetical protein [Mesomycoplasma hyopneumoniae]